jgi:hypothetical protein
MKLMDILLEDWEDDYRNVSHKLKLMYKLLRVGSVKISKLIPDFETPFWTGFDWIEDGDALITYELPSEYHLIPGSITSIYRIVIRGITINCEKYPALADDIDIREDLLRYILRRIENYLIPTLQEGDEIEFSIRKKHEENIMFKNVVNESVVDDKENDYDTVVKKAPTIFKALKKGKITMEVDAIRLFYRGATDPQKYTFDYDLGDVYIVETDPFENNYNVKVLIPAIKINCDENPNLNNIQTIKMDILNIVKKKFNNFGLNIILRATKFRLKHNGKWIIP